MRHGIVASLSGIGVAALLALFPATAPAAVAAPAPAVAAVAPVDVTASLSASAGRVAPGRSLYLTAVVRLVSGTVSEVGFTLTLPTGASWQRPDPANVQSKSCTAAPDGRSVTCLGYLPDGLASEQIGVVVDPAVPAGTELRFSMSAVIGGAANTDPAHGSAGADVLVKAGSDWGLTWRAPAKPVQPGTVVRTDLVVTNHGPDAETHTAHVDLTGFPFGKARPTNTPPGCLGDSADYTCRITRPLPAGSSVTYTFSWEFTAAEAGRTVRIPASFIDQVGLDPRPANDSAVLRIVVAESAAHPTASPTPTATATASATGAGTSGAGELADSGFDATPLVATGVGALLLGVLLVWGTRPARARRRR